MEYASYMEWFFSLLAPSVLPQIPKKCRT